MTLEQLLAFLVTFWTTTTLAVALFRLYREDFRGVHRFPVWLRHFEFTPEALGGFSYKSLLVVSFLGLFMEMLLIRWVSSEIRIFAHMGAEQVQQLVEACKEWPQGVVDADLHTPFKSAAAALLLSGADDPVTPPGYATVAQRAFADSKHVIVAGHGHGQLSAPCVDRIIANFVTVGSARGLDTACIDKLKPMPFFITLAGPGP